LAQEQELIVEELEVRLVLKTKRVEVPGPRRDFTRVVVERSFEVVMESVFEFVDPGLVLLAVHPRQGPLVESALEWR